MKLAIRSQSRPQKPHASRLTPPSTPATPSADPSVPNEPNPPAPAGEPNNRQSRPPLLPIAPNEPNPPRPASVGCVPRTASVRDPEIGFVSHDRPPAEREAETWPTSTTWHSKPATPPPIGFVSAGPRRPRPSPTPFLTPVTSISASGKLASFRTIESCIPGALPLQPRHFRFRRQHEQTCQTCPTGSGCCHPIGRRSAAADAASWNGRQPAGPSRRMTPPLPDWPNASRAPGPGVWELVSQASPVATIASPFRLGSHESILRSDLFTCQDIIAYSTLSVQQKFRIRRSFSRRQTKKRPGRRAPHAAIKRQPQARPGQGDPRAREEGRRGLAGLGRKSNPALSQRRKGRQGRREDWAPRAEYTTPPNLCDLGVSAREIVLVFQ